MGLAILHNLVQVSKKEVFLLTYIELKEIFCYYYKVDNSIYVATQPQNEGDWYGYVLIEVKKRIDKFRDSSEKQRLEHKDYSDWSYLLTDMCNEDAIPPGNYLIEVS